MRRIVIIPAGGKGLRSGFSKPKQFIKVKGKELIIYSLETFQRSRLIDDIIISVDINFMPLMRKLRDRYGLLKIKQIVEGGKERQDSVNNALSSISAEPDDLIIVHDAARPLLPADVLSRAIRTAEQKGNSVVCVRGSNTLIRGRSYVYEYISREDVLYVQTPQIFRYRDLTKAMRKAYEDNFYGTDESMLVRRTGKKVNITEGSNFNFKVTTKEDFKLLESMVQ